jgi:hypothetical protein
MVRMDESNPWTAKPGDDTGIPSSEHPPLCATNGPLETSALEALVYF